MGKISQWSKNVKRKTRGDEKYKRETTEVEKVLKWSKKMKRKTRGNERKSAKGKDREGKSIKNGVKK